jgi:CDGSH-type Zn-finger protein
MIYGPLQLPWVTGMSESLGKKIIVSKNGPYLVSGGIPIVVQVITANKEGVSWEWKQGESFDVKSDYALCRCGYSKTKPIQTTTPTDGSN